MMNLTVHRPYCQRYCGSQGPSKLWLGGLSGVSQATTHPPVLLVQGHWCAQSIWETEKAKHIIFPLHPDHPAQRNRDCIVSLTLDACAYTARGTSAFMIRSDFPLYATAWLSMHLLFELYVYYAELNSFLAPNF